MPPMDAPDKRSRLLHLLSLPPEIRINGVYKYLLPLPRDVKATFSWNGRLQKPEAASDSGTLAYKHRERIRKQQLRARLQAQGVCPLKDANDPHEPQVWQWTTLLLVSKALHDEIAEVVYGNMEICLLLTTDSTVQFDNVNTSMSHIPGAVCDDPTVVIAQLKSMWERRMFGPAGFADMMDPHSSPRVQFALMCKEQRCKRQLVKARNDQKLVEWAWQGRSAFAPSPASLTERQLGHLNVARQIVRNQRDTRSSATLGGKAPSNEGFSPVVLAAWQIPLDSTVPSIAQLAALPSPPPGVLYAPPALEQTLDTMEHRWCPCLANQRRIAEAQADIEIQLENHAKGMRNGFKRENCAACAKARARTLQIIRVPFELHGMVLIPPPEERWGWPIAKRYWPLVGKVRVVCDCVTLGRPTRSQLPHSFSQSTIRMGFALEEVVQRMNNSGLKCDMVVEMGFVCADRTMAWDAAKRLLRPFERCRISPKPKFNTLLWSAQADLVREKAVVNGNLDESLADSASLSFGEFLQGWKSKVMSEGVAPEFPRVVFVCNLIASFTYRLVDHSLLNVHGKNFHPLPNIVWRSTVDMREAADQLDFERLRREWRNISTIAFCEDDGVTEPDCELLPWKASTETAHMQNLKISAATIDAFLEELETDAARSVR